MKPTFPQRVDLREWRRAVSERKRQRRLLRNWRIRRSFFGRHESRCCFCSSGKARKASVRRIFGITVVPEWPDLYE